VRLRGKLKNFGEQLRGRAVHKVAAGYLLMGWAILESSALIFDTLELPTYSTKLLFVILVLGFPVALVVSWFSDIDTRGFFSSDAPGDGGFPLAPLVREQLSDSIPDDLSIAVLSFTDLSETQNSDHIGDGLAEEILNQLARLSDLRVIARTSSFAFKRQNKSIIEIASRLQVSYVLEGSLRSFGDTYRVSVQLIRARDGSQLLSDQYDGKLINLLRLQDDIARGVTDKLKVRLLQSSRSDNVAAADASTDLYLQAMQLLWTGKLTALRQSIEVLTRATEMDTGHANSYALLAYAYMLSAADPQADRRIESVLPQIQTNAHRALELDPHSEHANLSMAMYEMATKNWVQAEHYFLQAIAINPSCSRALGYYGYFLANTRRMDEGVLWASRAVAVDPLNAHELVRMAQLASYTGDQESALESARKALEQQPGFGSAYVWLVGIHGQMGDHEAAIDAMCRWNLVDMRLTDREEQEFRSTLADGGTLAYLKHWYVWLQKKRKRGSRSPHLPWFLGLYAVLNGQEEEALNYLEEAWGQTLMVPDFIFFQGLKSHPRYQALLNEYGLADADVTTMKQKSRELKSQLNLTLNY